MTDRRPLLPLHRSSSLLGLGGGGSLGGGLGGSATLLERDQSRGGREQQAGDLADIVARITSSSAGGGGGGGEGLASDGGSSNVPATTTVEVPLALHRAASCSSSDAVGGGGRIRLLLDDANLSVTSAVAGSSSSSTANAPVIAVDKSYLRGLASAECHTLEQHQEAAAGGGGGGKRTVLVTTAADPDCPHVLLIAAMTTTEGGSKSNSSVASTTSNSTIEFDLSSLSEFNQPIKVKTFLHHTLPADARPDLSNATMGVDVGDDMRQNMVRYDDDYCSSESSYRDDGLDNIGPVLRVVMVDTAGTILTVFLSYNSTDGKLNAPPTTTAKVAAAVTTAGGSGGIKSMHFHSIPSLITTSAPHLYLTPGTSLSASDVDFLSPTRLVVALSPHLLCVDIIKERVVPWTMAVGRRSTIGGILSQAGCMLLGKEIDEDDYVDPETPSGGGVGVQRRGGIADDEESMAPVSALTVVRHTEEHDGHEENGHSSAATPTTTTVVFSLHADGTLRLWYLGIKPSLLPKKVRLIRVPGEIGGGLSSIEGTTSTVSGGGRSALGFLSVRKAPRGQVRHPGEDPPLPEPSNWSSDVDAIMLCGKLYSSSSSRGVMDIAADDTDELRYALAVSVRTIEDPLAEFELAEQQQAAAATTPAASAASGRGRSPSFSNVGSPNHQHNHTSRQQQRIQLPSPCHLLVLSGLADAKPGLTGTDGAVPLIVSSDARNVVDMDFCPGDSARACELQALFATGDDAERRRYQATAFTAGGKVIDDDTAVASAVGTTSILSVYPPSTSTVVSHSSLPMGAASTVDFTALAERDSILDLKAGLKADITDGAFDTLEEATEVIDRACMTKLFRPIMARSVGGSHASPAAIRRAIRKLAPSYDLGSGASSKVEVDALLAVREWTRSDEARSTLLAVGRDVSGDDMQEDGATSTDVYNSFAKTPSKTKGRRGQSKIDSVEEEESEEMARKKKAEAHLLRWIKFLLAVQDEECIRRESLCIAALSSLSIVEEERTEVSVAVRGGMTTAVVAARQSVTDGCNNNKTIVAQLDALSVTVLRYLQMSAGDSLSEKLCRDIHRFTEIVAKAGLVMSKLDQDIVDSLAFLGSSAMNEIGARHHQPNYGYSPTTEGNASNTLLATVTSLLDALSAEEVREWLSPASASDSATVRPFLLGGDCSGGVAGPSASALGFSLGATAEMGTATCSAYVAHLHIDSVRELCLARCLLVLGIKRLVSAAAESAVAATAIMGRTAGAIIGGGSDAVAGAVPNEELANDASRAYLHASAVQWAASQKLEPRSSSSLALSIDSGSRDTSPVRSEGDAPPGSRPRVGGPLGSSSLPGIENFTVIEAVCLGLAKTNQASGGTSLLSLPLASSAMSVAKQFVGMAYGGAGGDGIVSQIAMLAPFSSQARIALRLLAPFVAYPDAYLDYETNQMTVEVAAECLLIEATFAEQNGTMSGERILSLRERASEILYDSCNYVDPSAMVDLSTICDILKKLHDVTKDVAMHDAMAALEDIMQKILRQPTPEADVSKDVQALCDMQTTKGLFLPWIEQANVVGTDIWTLIEQQYPPDAAPAVEADVTALCQVLLCISDLIRRVTILERHCSTAIGPSAIASGAGVVLKAIKDVVGAIDDLLPRTMAEEYMPEYPTLWSSAFSHATLERNWDEAYAACLANPMKERRLASFKRLVTGMADAGAIQELIGMPLTVVGKPKSPNQDVTIMDVDDEEGAETKTSSMDELDLYELAAETLANVASEQSKSRGTVVRGATNYGGCLYSLHASRANWRRASAAMAFGGTLAASKAAMSSSEKRKVDDKAIIDAIALAALGAAHSIQLEEMPSHRFIVKEEVGQYPVPPLFRDGLDESSRSASNKRGRDGRRPLFATKEQAQDSPTANRKSRLMMEKDLIAQAIQKVGLRTLVLDNGGERDVLASLQKSSRDIIVELASNGYYDLALGVAKTIYDEQNGARHTGRDAFYDALSYIICRHLVPRAVVGNAFDSSRPTLSQVHSSAERVDDSFHAAPSTGVDGWKSQDLQLKSAQGAACMDLLRSYTTKYANSTNNLAIEVAAVLLDLDSKMSMLPIWLTDLLCGNTPACFARMVSANENAEGGNEGQFSSAAANPNSLVKLYMKRAMYSEACKVTVKVLEQSNSRVGSSAARLPEEGDIDFVPYNTIDQLWNIIESASQGMDDEEKTGMLKAREEMELALENHMKQMRISEDGLKSARALKMQTFEK